MALLCSTWASSPKNLVHMGFFTWCTWDSRELQEGASPNAVFACITFTMGYWPKQMARSSLGSKDGEIDSTSWWEEAQSHLQREWKQGFENLWLFCKALCKYCHFVNNLLSYFPLFPFPFILVFLTLLLSFASGYLFLKWRARSLSYLL